MIFHRFARFILSGLILSGVLCAQSGPVDRDHPVYPFLRRQAALDNLPQNWLATQPVSWQQVNDLLNQVGQSRQILSRLDQRLLDRFSAEFSKPNRPTPLTAPWQLHTWRDAGRGLLTNKPDASPYPHGLTYRDSSTAIWADWREGLRIQNNGSHARGYYTDQLVFRGYLNDHFSFYWDFIQYRLSNVSNYPDLPPEYKQGHIIDQEELDWYVWNLGQAGLYTSYPNWSLTLAQEPVYWGYSPNLTPILNTRVYPYTHIRFSVDYKVVHFTTIQGGLLPENPSEFNKDIPDKRIAAQRISVDFSPNLTLAFNEFEIYARRPFEPGYLVPIIFYWAEENLLGDRDNLLMAVDGIYRIMPGLQVYGTFFWDELDWFELNKDSWKNKFAPQIGLFCTLPSEIIAGDLRIEYTAVHPWTYTHDDSLNSFTSAGTGLGFPHGPNSAVLDIQSNLWLSPRLSLFLDWLWLRKGDGLGSDVLDNYADRDMSLDHKTTGLMGTITSSHLGSIQLRYRVNAMVEFTGRYEATRGDSTHNFWELGLHLDW
ncbi:MAG: hypothetical protein K9N11_03120 [Lentisphaeria bacterium]|nr:hypothetical protein [Lentisphaeria bacterium]